DAVPYGRGRETGDVEDAVPYGRGRETGDVEDAVPYGRGCGTGDVEDAVPYKCQASAISFDLQTVYESGDRVSDLATVLS
ncbi:MAG: hypothetical protein IJF88_04700, partial [Oscillospiraceae bacterium]|nr:hypothetical protein [Oscillospiraceae bacterium]